MKSQYVVTSMVLMLITIYSAAQEKPKSRETIIELQPNAGYVFSFTLMNEKAYSFSNHFPSISGVPYPEIIDVYSAPHNWSMDPSPYVGLDIVIGTQIEEDVYFSMIMGYTYSRRSQYSFQTYTNSNTRADIYLDRLESKEEYRIGLKGHLRDKLSVSSSIIIYRSVVEIPRFELIQNPKSPSPITYNLDTSGIMKEDRGITLALGIDFYLSKYLALNLTYQPSYVTVGKNYGTFSSGGSLFERYGFWAHNFHLGIVIPIRVTSFNGGPESQK